MSTQKRCHYEVLGLEQSSTQDQIRSAYKKLALQRHPDKLVQSGLSSEAATASFQELVQAYEVLSDPKERSWYDSHRSQILFSSTSNSDNSDSLSPIPDLFSYFSPSCYTDYTNSKTGFYKVYSGVFDKIYANEVSYARRMGLSLSLVKEAPLMGDLGSDFNQVNAFYGYWLGFSTIMDFGWVDKWDAAAGLNRKSRRVMEEENKKVRKKAKKEFNETIRGLAEFVKKRDKRVIDMMVKKEKEREKKREEEIAKKKEREREKLERARMYEEPEWARVEDMEEFEELEEDDEGKGKEKKQLCCVVCEKKFKSEKQWKNHEQSKKHKEKVAELRKFFTEEEGFEEVEEEEEDEVGAKSEDMEGNEKYENDVGDDGFKSAEDNVDELDEKFRDTVGLDEGKNMEELHSNAEEPSGSEDVGSEDESSILESMISGRRNKKHVSKNQPMGSSRRNYTENEDEESMDYNDKKGKKKSRRAKKEKGKVFEAEVMKTGDCDANVRGAKDDKLNDSDIVNGGDDDQANHGKLNHAVSEDEESMEYNNKKGKKKSRRAKKDKGQVFEPEAMRAGDRDTNVRSEEDGKLHSSDIGDGRDDDQQNEGIESSMKAGKQPVERKGTSKVDVETRPKNSTKGRKQKEKVKKSDPVCEKCGEEFDSRNMLHKHLSETGHSLKFK